MGYLSCPRIYFFGQFRMDAATGNNFQQVNFFGQQFEFFSVADVTVNTKFGDRELSDAEMRQFLAEDNLPNWNYFGSNEFSFPDAKITGYDLGAGVRTQGDPLIGADVNFERALLVSLNPAGLLSAQVISDCSVLGDASKMGLSGPPARAFSRWIWFGRNPEKSAGCSRQCGKVQPMETRGVVNGKQVVLEDAVPALEGKRVRVRLDALDDERTLSQADQMDAWRGWVESGPHGPIEDDRDDWP